MKEELNNTQEKIKKILDKVCLKTKCDFYI